MSNKEKYFSISEAVEDISSSFGAKETATASLKLFGKGIFNVTKYATTEILPEIVKRAKENKKS